MLTDRVHTFGQWLKAKHGERVHKIALDAGFTCPNRDGSKGIGGCTFCNNASFNASVAQQRSALPSPAGGRGDGGEGDGAACLPVSPNGRAPVSLDSQLDSGRRGIARRTRARKYLAYFQAYTNTYAHVDSLKAMYDQAMAMEGMIGLSVGTRPDCVPPAVLDLLASYRDRGREVWLVLGLQSAFDESLARVNRGHGYAEYAATCRAARERGLPVCTHLIIGLPGETEWHFRRTLERVLETGVDGLKLHPLHVVRHTLLAHQWRQGEYTPLAMDDYIRVTADLIERTPAEVIYHRVTGTAPADVLLAPSWCRYKWQVINGIEDELRRRGTRQGAKQDGKGVGGREVGETTLPAGRVAPQARAGHSPSPYPIPAPQARGTLLPSLPGVMP
jgi:radical SAM protein (TIGR01212 family)